MQYNSQTAIIPLPHTGYLDKVLGSASYEELMWRFMDAEHPAKEISESYAAFSTLKRVCRVNHYNWIHIGDGAYTRTAAIFAFFSKSFNYSVDPVLNLEKFNKWREKWNVLGICPHKGGYETFPEDAVLKDKPYSICCVHAHVKLEEVDKHFPNWHYMYTNPCCFESQQKFSEKYIDENSIRCIVQNQNLGILSERREVCIYVNLRVKQL